MKLPYEGSFEISQEFGQNFMRVDVNGNQYSVYEKLGMRGHNGADFRCPINTNILAPFSGTVIEARFDPDGYGNYVKLEDDSQGSTLAHLSDFVVHPGDHVEEGQFLGHSGNTGNSTGPHLHWGYYTIPRNRNNGYDGYIDQRPLLESLGLLQPLHSATTSTVALPVAVNVVTEPEMYNGLDLNNKDSMKVCVDTWKKLSDGELVDHSVLDEALTRIQTLEHQPETPSTFVAELNAVIKERDQYKDEAVTLAESLKNTVNANEQSVRLAVQAVEAENEELKKKGAELLLTLDEVKKNSPDLDTSLEEKHQLENQKTELKLLLSQLQQKYDICETEYQTYKTQTGDELALLRSEKLVASPAYQEGEKDRTITGLTTQVNGLMEELRQALLAKTRLTKELARKDEEDYTAITIGIEAARKLEASFNTRNPFLFIGQLLKDLGGVLKKPQGSITPKAASTESEGFLL